MRSVSMPRYRLVVRCACCCCYCLVYMMFLFCLSKVFPFNTLCTQRNEWFAAERSVIIIYGYETRAKVYVSLADSEYVPLNFKDVFSRELKKFSFSLPRPVYFIDDACVSLAFPVASSNAIAYILYSVLCERQILLSAVKSIFYIDFESLVNV